MTVKPANQIKIVFRGPFVKGHYEPGNGTSYRAIAIHWQDGEYQQALGTVSDGVLVVSCNTGMAYLFQKEGPLLDEYIQKHLGGLRGDYPYFGDLIRAMLARPNLPKRIENPS